MGKRRPEVGGGTVVVVVEAGRRGVVLPGRRWLRVANWGRVRGRNALGSEGRARRRGAAIMGNRRWAGPALNGCVERGVEGILVDGAIEIHSRVAACDSGRARELEHGADCAELPCRHRPWSHPPISNQPLQLDPTPIHDRNAVSMPAPESMVSRNMQPSSQAPSRHVLCDRLGRFCGSQRSLRSASLLC